MNCSDCEKRTECKKPCGPVWDILSKDNQVMEHHFADHIRVFPGSSRETHMSSLTEKQLSEISSADVVPWSIGDWNFTQTKIFIEVFFNKASRKELADYYGVKENTITCMYQNAVERVNKIVKKLDARREGLKAMKPGKFTDDEKLFLLVHVFGFTQREAAEMFNLDKNRVNMVVKRLADKYASAYEGMTKDEMSRRMRVE